VVCECDSRVFDGYVQYQYQYMYVYYTLLVLGVNPSMYAPLAAVSIVGGSTVALLLAQLSRHRGGPVPPPARRWRPCAVSGARLVWCVSS